MDAIKRNLRRLDVYPKTVEDFREKTTSGAIVSLIMALFVLWLFVSELGLYMTTEVNPQLYVDTTRGEKLRINIDVLFPSVPCSYITVDAMDVSGEIQLDIAHNLFKKRLKDGRPVGVQRENLSQRARMKKQLEGDAANNNNKDAAGKTEVADGKPIPGAKAGQPNCGSCYGAEATPDMCCNTCEEVREAYRQRGWAFTNPQGIAQCVAEGFMEDLAQQQDESCQIYGYILSNKVAGNVHFAPGKSFQQHQAHVHDYALFQKNYFNLSHTINTLSFGQVYPGILNPLDKVTKLSTKAENSMFSYYIKVVPTRYENLAGTVIKTNQYSVTEHERALSRDSGHGIPGVFFMYDLSPITVHYTETKQSFAHFITSLCAIIGGVFTVAGFIDSLVYHGARSLRRKMQVGKLG